MHLVWRYEWNFLIKFHIPNFFFFFFFLFLKIFVMEGDKFAPCWFSPNIQIVKDSEASLDKSYEWLIITRRIWWFIRTLNREYHFLFAWWFFTPITHHPKTLDWVNDILVISTIPKSSEFYDTVVILVMDWILHKHSIDMACGCLSHLVITMRQTFFSQNLSNQPLHGDGTFLSLLGENNENSIVLNKSN